jgi:dGTPase
LHGEEFIRFLEKESEILKKEENKIITEYFFEATRSLECQILNAADDIAYATHDIEDGVESGLINIGSKEQSELILNNEPLVDDFFKNLYNIFKANNSTMPRLNIKIKLKKFFSNYISKFITNIDIEERYEFLSDVKVIKSALQLSNKGEYFNESFIAEHLIIPGIDVKDNSYKYRLIWKNNVNMEIKALKQISYKLIMESRNILLNRHKAKNIIEKLFGVFSGSENIKLYPEEFQELYENGFYDEYGKDNIYIMCSDYISGMTDIYAIKLYSALFETGNIAGNIGTF